MALEGLDPTSIGRRIALAMERAGLTRAGLAARMGSDAGDVSRWVHGRAAQSVETLGRIADALNIPVWHLLVDVDHGTGRGEIDAARRLTIKMTMAWRDGRYADEQQMASATREVAEQAYTAVGQAYIEGWLAGSGLFTTESHDEAKQERNRSEADPAGRGAGS
jgi:transcriptional regulator with XRE-family HTH domain